MDYRESQEMKQAVLISEGLTCELCEKLMPECAKMCWNATENLQCWEVVRKHISNVLAEKTS